MPPSFVVIDGIKCYAPELCEHYEDYPSEGFDVTDQLEAESFWCRSRNRVLGALVTKLARSLPRPVRFLEIGCGTGFFMRDLAPRTDIEMTGSEVYLKGLKYAQSKAPELRFIQLDAMAIPFEEEFDLVGAFDVIEHIDADEAVIAGVRRALKPGGLFVVAVPQYRFLWSKLDELVKHKRRYSRRELVSKLRANGLDVVYVSSFLFVLFPLMLAARLLDRIRPARPVDDKAAFTERVSFPRPINWLFDRLMRIDEWLVSLGVSLPVGGSLLAVARKRPGESQPASQTA